MYTYNMNRLTLLTLNGGKGSGNWGHSGRPGKVGVSGKGGGKAYKTAREVFKGIESYNPEEGIDGGFTIGVKEVKTYELGKSDGYAVGGFGTEKIVEITSKKAVTKAIADYVKENESALKEDGACIGGWIPSEGDLKGKLVLDVSRVFTDKKEATIWAIKTDQDSITDFKNSDWPTKEDLAKEFKLEKELEKYKGIRAKERSNA